MRHKQHEEVHARKRLGSIEILDGNLRELRTDGAREFVSKAMRLMAKNDGTNDDDDETAAAADK